MFNIIPSSAEIASEVEEIEVGTSESAGSMTSTDGSWEQLVKIKVHAKTIRPRLVSGVVLRIADIAATYLPSGIGLASPPEVVDVEVVPVVFVMVEVELRLPRRRLKMLRC